MKPYVSLGLLLGALLLLAQTGSVRQSSTFEGYRLAPPEGKVARELRDEPMVKPKPAPTPKEGALDEAIKRGIAFLLQDQNKDGSWGGSQFQGGVMIYAPIPGAHQGFRAAVTAMSVAALIEVGGTDANVNKAIDRGEVWLLEHLPKVRRANADAIYNVWSHTYGIQALALMHGRTRDAVRKKTIEDQIRVQYELLERYESVDGGWGYYDFRVGSKKPSSDSISFTTGAALVAFHEAKRIGVPPPEKLTKRALDSIQRQRKSDHSYLYGEYLKWQPMLGINRPGGSLGRSQCCNLALRVWGDTTITDKVVSVWLDRLFSRNLWLDIGRKRPIPHESHFQVAGYFFYFGHYYASLCLELLPAEERGFYQDHLAQILLKLQEKDGSWWDFPFYNYHRQYGTAFVLMSLKRCQRTPAVRGS